MILRYVLPLTLAAGAVAAAAQQSSAGKSADRFSLDLPSSDATPTAEPSPEATAATPLPAPSLPDNAAVTGADAPAEGARTTYTLDTPIGDLIANPATKAVLDKDLPGLSSDENLEKFDKLGLKQFQPLTGGQLTDAMLAKVAKDLAATAGAPLAAPAKPVGGRRSRDESR